MNRRQFLAYGGVSAAGLSAPTLAFAQTTPVDFDLTIEPVDVELIDGRVVYMLLYYADDRATPRPTMRTVEGETIAIRVRNNAPLAHGFAIPGIPAASTGPIAPGATATVVFTAPQAGSYLYLDPLNAPAHRLLGLHGAFVIEPRDGRTPSGVATPFSSSAITPAVATLFESFSEDSTRFPGDPWKPGREKIWLFTQVDPLLCEQAEMGRTIVGTTVQRTFRARYFTINGLSGFDASEEPTIKPKGYVGEPLLIRTMNAGRNTHSPHIHGNHILECTTNDASGAVVVQSNVIERDSWSLGPLDRKDVMLPFERPQDIPPAVWPPKEEPFPLRYAMHCHIEMSQTAGGGNYPQGLTTHWELLGPTRPKA